ncbi:MAG: M15 family metallopeptidase [Myxococcaceae bacterium]|nr:M15 family metallopeptidase [Myxococcaceae bacterium]
MNPRSLTVSLFVVAAACGLPLPDEADEADNGFDDSASVQQRVVSCAESQSTGYRSGSPFPVTLITIDGYPVEKTTGNAYAVMQAAAAAAGVPLRINSGFRTPQQQQYLYSCYVNCNCNSCNLAAAPGYSNHQSGTALDLNTANGAVFSWLNGNAARFGFRRTVPSEPWHWEYFGGGPGGGPCSAPPPCDRSWGPFTFSCDGAQSNMACVNVNEPSDPHTWNDNFFCSSGDLGLRWSHAGAIDGMTCVNTHESAEANASIWADNFLCSPPQSPWKLSWSSAGPIAGRGCIHWNETADPNSWHDNHLCAEQVATFSEAGYTFSMAGPVAGSTCVAVNEPADPDTWNDNFFCSPTDVGMRWSHVGPIAGMVCTKVDEPAEKQAAIWADNFLCVPETAPVRFRWSTAGRLAGLPCVRWFEHSDTSPTWLDNWLCIETPALAGGNPTQTLGPIGGVDVVPVTPVVPRTPETMPEDLAVEPRQQEMVGGCAAAPGLVPLLALALLRRRRGLQSR